MFVQDVEIFDIKEKHYTDEGYIRIPATVARTGIQEYSTDEPFMVKQLSAFPEQFRKPGIIIRVLRPEDEVFKPDSMDTFKSKPVTNDHPSELLSVRNAKDHTVGLSGSTIEQIDNMLKTDLVIWDSKTISEIENGKHQISSGYQSNLIWESGNDPEHGPYDAKFTDIIGNHIAIVQYGRAGNQVKLLDEKKGELEKMAKRIIGNVEVEISDDKVGLLDAIMTEKSGLEKSVKEHLATIDEKSKEIEDSKKEIEKLKGEKDAIEAQLQDSSKLDELVESRVAMIETGKAHVKDFDHKGKSNGDIKKEVIATKLGIDLEDKSVEYIDAAFDVAMKTKSNDNNEVADELGRIAEIKTWQSARDKFVADSREMYKGVK